MNRYDGIRRKNKDEQKVADKPDKRYCGHFEIRKRSTSTFCGRQEQNHRKNNGKYDRFDFEREMIEERVRNLKMDILESARADLDKPDDKEDRRSTAYEIHKRELEKRRADRS